MEDYYSMLKERGRRHERKQASVVAKIYSGLFPGALIARTANISRSGAKIYLKHTPDLNEVITWEAVDESGQCILSCNARVVWTKNEPKRGECFGIEFERALPDDQANLLWDTEGWLDWNEDIS